METEHLTPYDFVGTVDEWMELLTRKEMNIVEQRKLMNELRDCVNLPPFPLYEPIPTKMKVEYKEIDLIAKCIKTENPNSERLHEQCNRILKLIAKTDKKRSKIYLSGKITGLELSDAQKLFENAEQEMEQFYDVVAPRPRPDLGKLHERGLNRHATMPVYLYATKLGTKQRS
jgi:hypothetical protein